MYITLELLEKKRACDQGRNWFSKRFPDGAELIDVINHKYVTDHFLEWGLATLDTSPEEKLAFYKKLEIDCGENNFTITKSKKVKNSKQVAQSKSVSDSYNIVKSEDVYNSENICNSKYVENAQVVFNSSYVYDSNYINNGVNVNDSNNIYDSNYIVNSSNIIRAKEIFDSHYIVGSQEDKIKNIKNSWFIKDCENLSHCLFCQGLKDKEYYIFNQQSDEATYNLIVKQMKKILQNYSVKCIKDWGIEKIPMEENLYLHTDDQFYSKLPPQFFDWIKTLPKYNNLLLFTITLNKAFLI